MGKLPDTVSDNSEKNILGRTSNSQVKAFVRLNTVVDNGGSSARPYLHKKFLGKWLKNPTPFDFNGDFAILIVYINTRTHTEDWR